MVGKTYSHHHMWIRTLVPKFLFFLLSGLVTKGGGPGSISLNLETSPAPPVVGVTSEDLAIFWPP